MLKKFRKWIPKEWAKLIEVVAIVIAASALVYDVAGRIEERSARDEVVGPR